MTRLSKAKIAALHDAIERHKEELEEKEWQASREARERPEEQRPAARPAWQKFCEFMRPACDPTDYGILIWSIPIMIAVLIVKNVNP